LSRLHQGLLRVGASRIRSQKEESNEDDSSGASSDEEAAPSSNSEGSDENTSADLCEDGEGSCFHRGLKKKTMLRKTRAKTGKNGRRSQSPAPSDEEVCLVCKVRAPTCLKWNIRETNVSFNLYSSVLLLFPVVDFLET
jgi:hypothetical protein